MFTNWGLMRPPISTFVGYGEAKKRDKIYCCPKLNFRDAKYAPGHVDMRKHNMLHILGRVSRTGSHNILKISYQQLLKALT